ncbi:MAG: PIN/TRAM domain-containing protein [Planctomycetes bacterium]|nr:PIN/TRAM domain-containing protein [Planctomycetota bacterium]
MPDSAHRPELHPLEAAERQRTNLLRILRMAFFVLLLSVTLLAIFKDPVSSGGDGGVAIQMVKWWGIPLAGAVVLFIMAIGVDLITPHKKITTLSGIFFGLLAGMAATLAFSYIIDLLAELWTFENGSEITSTAKVLVGISLCYLAIATVLSTQDDFRLVIPYVEFSKQLRGSRPLLIDTSALIDARIADLAETGILDYPVVVPRFVIDELQRLADSQDRLKRARGRRGLDVVSKLQRLPTLDLSIDETIMPGKAVDQMLVELARSMPARIVSADVALSRIANIQGVEMLNLNDVANALKPAVIPGEQLTIHLIKRGEQPGQAVGYLDDGTMVVAEDGSSRLGQRVSIAVTSAIQTSSGRLIFGRLTEEYRPPEGPLAPPPEHVVETPGHTEPPERAEPSERAEPPAEAALDPLAHPRPAQIRGPKSPRDGGHPGQPRNPRR